jgi:S1-C subfamily serine protease
MTSEEISRRDLLRVAGASVALTSLLSPVFLNFYNNHFHHWRLRQAFKTVLENTVTLQTTSDVQKEPRKGQGTIIDDYVITVAHIIDTSIQREVTPSGHIYYNVDVEGEETKIGDSKLERILVDSERDIAVLKLPRDYQKPNSKVMLGDSSQLKPFDRVYLLGDTLDLIHVAREGIVGNYEEKIDMNYTIMGMPISVNANLGDSGSLVINEGGEGVGLLSNAIAGTYSVMAPINLIKRVVVADQLKMGTYNPI